MQPNLDVCVRCLKRPPEHDSPLDLCNGCEDDVHFDLDPNQSEKP